MQKTKIEWVRNPDGTQGMSWNPIKGLCPVNCWYCYAKPLYYRFEWILEDTGEIGYLAEWELEQPIKRKKPTGIFVCSTYELFHSPDKFARDEIFKTIEQCPQHRFYILTKRPENIDRPMPDNVWLGTTVEKQMNISRITDIEKIEAKKRFVSFEPLFGFINWDGYRLEFSSLDWMIMGRLTGHGKEHDPKLYWVNQIKFYAGYYGIPLFMKNNLKKIWKEPLIQELPE